MRLTAAHFAEICTAVTRDRFDASPAAALRPFVSSYWGFVRDLSAQPRFRVTPDCYVEMIFFVDPPRDADGAQLAPCALIPLLSEPLDLVFSAVVRCAAVRFQAWIAGLLFPQAETTERAWYDASAEFGDLLPRITAALELEDWDAIGSAFDEALIRRLAGVNDAVAGIAAARSFLTSPADVEVRTTSDVAADAARSRRQIERQVRRLTNRSPKQLVGLRRFQFARDTLWAHPATPLDAVALEAGYADQAHLTREFQRYAGQSPGTFRRDCARLRAIGSEADVAIVQDGPPESSYATEV